MTIFRSEAFLALASLALLAFAAWVVCSSIRQRSTTLAGQVISKSEHPLAYNLIVGFWALAAFVILIVALQLVLGWDVRFWIK